MPRRQPVIEVRIRHESDAEAVRLCDWPATQLDDVIPAIKQWGVFDVANCDAYDVDAEMTGQFAFSPSGGFFEVVIHESESGA